MRDTEHSAPQGHFTRGQVSRIWNFCVKDVRVESHWRRCVDCRERVVQEGSGVLRLIVGACVGVRACVRNT